MWSASILLVPGAGGVLAGAAAGVGGGEGGDAGEVAGGADGGVLLVVAVAGVGAVGHHGDRAVAGPVGPDLGAVHLAARVVDGLLHRHRVRVRPAQAERRICSQREKKPVSSNRPSNVPLESESLL